MDSLHHLDHTEIHLYAYYVMPNHVHAIFDLHSKRKLHQVMQSHKTFTARRANVILERTGMPFWEQETYDHVIRKGRLAVAIWYTLLNPVKAGFVKRWQDWPGTYLAPEIHGFE
jgi:putative transposase